MYIYTYILCACVRACVCVCGVCECVCVADVYIYIYVGINYVRRLLQLWYCNTCISFVGVAFRCNRAATELQQS